MNLKLLLKNRKAQVNPRDLIALIALIIFLPLAIFLVTLVINAISSGNLENSINAVIGVFIPLFIFAIFFDLIKRFLR
jgi:polyferredoxin